MAKIGREQKLTVTDNRLFRGHGHMVRVQVSDTKTRFAWRMRVGRGKCSGWYSYYEGILVHDGYGLATAYWEGCFKEFVPFKIMPTTEIPNA